MTTAILTYFDNRITINPDICNGKPTLRNKRITVQTVLELLRGCIKTKLLIFIV